MNKNQKEMLGFIPAGDYIKSCLRYASMRKKACTVPGSGSNYIAWALPKGEYAVGFPPETDKVVLPVTWVDRQGDYSTVMSAAEIKAKAPTKLMEVLGEEVWAIMDAVREGTIPKDYLDALESWMILLTKQFGFLDWKRSKL